MCYKRYLNILVLIAFFSLVFHVTLNSRNTKLKNYGVHWGSLDIQIFLHIGSKPMYFVFSRYLRLGMKLTNCDLMHTTSPDLSHMFSILNETTLHCVTPRLLYYLPLILCNLFYWCFKLWLCYKPNQWGSLGIATPLDLEIHKLSNAL